MVDFSLYFHVPFCTRKCDYCHFYVIPNHERFKNIYKKALRLEWDFRSPLGKSYSLSTHPPEYEGAKLQAHTTHSPCSIYFGGGTPSLLSPDEIQSILSWVSPHNGCEITLEVNPETVTLDKMRGFKKAGINRLSLGIQSFNSTELMTLSREHSDERAKEAIDLCFKAGFENISIDLMYDLPNQTLESWRVTLNKALSFPLSHLSLYNLTIEPHTSFFKRRESLKQPKEGLSLELLNLALEKLDLAGFHRYEISAFSRWGKESIHNTGYWLGRPFLGFGPSAFSYWEGVRFRNTPNLNRYAKALELGHDPIDFSEKLLPKEALLESLAIRLRRIEGIPLHVWPSEIEAGVTQLQREGFIERQGDFLKLTHRGLLFHDTVAAEIMSW